MMSDRSDREMAVQLALELIRSTGGYRVTADEMIEAAKKIEKHLTGQGE